MKTKTPGVAPGASLDPCAARAATQSEHSALPPQRQRQLAISLHSDRVAVTVVESRDGSRIDVETWTKHDNGWRLGGFTPSFAAIVLDEVIAALIQAREVRSGR